jgi:hypothetical protein
LADARVYMLTHPKEFDVVMLFTTYLCLSQMSLCHHLDLLRSDNLI